MLRIKKDDTVTVISGKDKGKSGRVMRIFPAVSKAIVENINLVKKSKRRTQQDQKGGIIDIEAPIHLSNLMLVDKQSNGASRFKVEITKDGQYVNPLPLLPQILGLPTFNSGFAVGGPLPKPTEEPLSQTLKPDFY